MFTINDGMIMFSWDQGEKVMQSAEGNVIVVVSILFPSVSVIRIHQPVRRIIKTYDNFLWS